MLIQLIDRVDEQLDGTEGNIVRMQARIAMGKMKENPKYNVLSLRVDDDLIERIRKAARNCTSISDFLETAAREKLQADEERVFRAKVDGRLGR